MVSSQGHSPALDLFLEHQYRRGSAEGPEFEGLCAAHPEHADELRVIKRNWDHLEELKDRFRQSTSLGERARSALDSALDSHISPEGDGEHAADFTEEIQARLRERRGAFGRYSLEEEVAEGGQGAIFRVWDEDLRRNLAMKVILKKAGSFAPGTDKAASKSRGRFVEEAQVTGQLDHPGIVPVHELGLDDLGQLYFTMKLVKGEDLKRIFDLVHAGEEGWTQTRAVSVMLKVCEAMAYAHHKGVIHRDLKPSNVMVGRFGEVYVMDWGLARVMGCEDRRDIRIREEEVSEIHSERRELAEDSPDMTLMTNEGDVLGTPCYMSPEQAWGDLQAIGPRSDVYAVGTMLYDLLANQAPYVPPGSHLNNRTVWRFVREGPPESLLKLAPDAPSELIAISQKAMAREPEDRYADMLELAEDLRAYLEDRVVRAYRTGTLISLRKWLHRNRLMAGALGAAAAILLISTVVFIARLTTEVHAKEDALWERNRVSFGPVSADLLQHAEGFPIAPEFVEEMEAWVRDAEGVQADAEPHLADELDPVNGEAVRLLGELRELVPTVRARAETARELHAVSIEAHRADWEEAIAGIASSPQYALADGGGLRLEPQLGLAPLGENPYSGLWEFWVVLTGDRPEGLDLETGNWEMGPETGMVLVLLPGDPEYMMGSDDPDQDMFARTCVVDLHPFFLAKHEVSQGQWMRLEKENPSLFGDGTTETPYESPETTVLFDLTHPVDSVSWAEAAGFCRRVGLLLPTEAQWEYACKAGTTTDHWFGDGLDMARLKENLAGWQDPYPYHAPIGSLAPNPFGLFDMHGNVAEWCRDVYRGEYGPPRMETGDGLCPPETEAESRARGAEWLTMVYRGGSWYTEDWPSVTRTERRPDFRSEDRGLRAAGPLRPCPGCE